MGLGSPFGETLISNPSSPKFQNRSAAFPMIYDQLYQNGYISTRLFSIWLNDESASEGSILFGGIDHSKYHGSLQNVSLLLDGPGVFTSWAVNLTSIALDNGYTKKPLTANGSVIRTVLDSGSPNMYLPPDIADAVAEDMNATMYQGFPYVSCELHHSNKSLEFGFNSASKAGPRISVPYGEIIYPYGNPTNIGNVTAPNGTRLCYLGLIGSPDPRSVMLLGDTFMRSAYMVYDVDNLHVGMASVRYR